MDEFEMLEGSGELGLYEDFEDYGGDEEMEFLGEDGLGEEMYLEEGFGGDYEGEWEGMEYEGDYESSEIAEMEALAEAALEAESEEEAEAFIGAIASLASKILPKAISIGRKVLPHVIKGATRLFRQVRRSPAGRAVVRSLPTVMRGTMRQTLQRISQGQPVTPTYVARTMAGQAARLMKNPAHRRAMMRKHHMMVRRAAAMRRHPRAGRAYGQRCRWVCY